MSKFDREIEGVALHGECHWWCVIDGVTFDLHEGKVGVDLMLSGPHSPQLGTFATMRAAVQAARRHAGVPADGGGADTKE